MREGDMIESGSSEIFQEECFISCCIRPMQRHAIQKKPHESCHVNPKPATMRFGSATTDDLPAGHSLLWDKTVCRARQAQQCCCSCRELHGSSVLERFYVEKVAVLW